MALEVILAWMGFQEPQCRFPCRMGAHKDAGDHHHTAALQKENFAERFVDIPVEGAEEAKAGRNSQKQSRS